MPETIQPRLTRRARDRAERLDFPFAEGETPEEHRRIAEDLDLIARTVAAADPAFHALILTGGFSRGEGTVRDGRPLNDYDLIAVRGRPGGDGHYRRLAHELTETVGLEVDMLPVWRRRLPRVGHKLFWLDVTLGGRVIAGDVGVLHELPRMGATDLPRREIARLLGNRAAGLLLALPGPGQAAEQHQVDLQSAKAVLAAQDAILLHKGLYAPRLRDRLALSRGHASHGAFAAAVDWKLRGGADVPAISWEEAAAVLLDAVEETDAREARDGAAEHALYLVRAHRLRVSPSQRLRLAAWELLRKSRFPEGPDPREARRILRGLGHAEGNDWRALRTAFFALRARTLQ